MKFYSTRERLASSAITRRDDYFSVMTSAGNFGFIKIRREEGVIRVAVMRSA